MKRATLLIPLAGLLAACAALGTPTPTDSGITGQALIGPICPVVRVGGDCPDAPYQATLTVLDSRGAVVVRFETDEEGRFRVPLAPGEYTLRPESPEGKPLPIAGEQTFRVNPGTFTELTVNYDSGIR
jgi:hypothetical protein